MFRTRVASAIAAASLLAISVGLVSPSVPAFATPSSPDVKAIVEDAKPYGTPKTKFIFRFDNLGADVSTVSYRASCRGLSSGTNGHTTWGPVVVAVKSFGPLKYGEGHTVTFVCPGGGAYDLVEGRLLVNAPGDTNHSNDYATMNNDD